MERKGVEVTTAAPSSFDPVHGFEEGVSSRLLDNLKHNDIQEKAAAANKPFMVMISQPWCEACQVLARSINRGQKTKDLLDSFVVTIVHGEAGQKEWQEEKHDYVPQALFFDVDGTRLEVEGPHTERGYKNFFSSDEEISDAMAKALDQSKVAGEL